MPGNTILILTLVALASLPALADEHPAEGEIVASLIRRGESELARDEFEAARHSFLKARELLQSRAEPRLQLAALLGLADIDIKEGNYAGAGELLAEAEEQWQKSGDPALGARLWTLRAGIAFRQRRTGDALGYRIEAVEQARLTGDSALLFQALTNLARAYLDVHDYATAIPIFSETADLKGSALDQVVNRIQLGIAQFELNQFDAARQSFEAARVAASEHGSPRLEGTAIGELGLIAWEERRAANDAAEYFSRAIAIMDAIGDRVNAVAWRTNQALVLRETGRCEEALQLYQALEAELQSIEGQQVWPTIYKGMGQCQLEVGLVAEARRSIDECLDAARRGGDSKRIWECQQLRGRLNADAGDFDAAREAYEAALAEIEQLRVSLMVGRFKADFFENKLPVFHEYAAMIIEHLPAAEAAEKTLEISERARARAFLDEFAHSGGSYRESIPDELLQQEEGLLRQIRNLRAQGPGSGNAAEIARLEIQLDGLAVSARQQLAIPVGHSRPSPLDEIRAALAPGELMLVYWLADPNSYLWSISRDAIEHHSLPAASELAPRIRAAYGELTNPGSRPEMAELAQSLLSPVVQEAQSVARLLIVPSGILHYFPFEVLPLSGGEILADRASTSYLPSASTLVYLRQAPPRPDSPGLLAVGDLPYPAPREDRHPSTFADFAPLPFSGPEIRAAGNRFGQRATRLVTGEEASESLVKSLPLDSYSVLHFATHGWIDAASHSASSLVLVPDAGSEDGLLQVREIRQLDLDAELVILSACQSALGRLVTGEGMVGLTRAFLDAGARSVVASLWNVNDQASADFMDAFYARLASGEERAKALRNARISLRARAEYRHPYYWAAWVLVGDGRGGVTFPVRRQRWALLALGLLLIAGTWGWRRIQSRS